MEDRIGTTLETLQMDEAMRSLMKIVEIPRGSGRSWAWRSRRGTRWETRTRRTWGSRRGR